MDKFTQLFLQFSQGKYDYLRVKKVDIIESTRTVHVYFYVREDIYDAGLSGQLNKDLTSFFRRIIKNYTFKYFYERLIVSADLVHSVLADYIHTQYPFVAANIQMETVEVEVLAERIDCTLYMPTGILAYARGNEFIDALKQEISDSFLMPCTVHAELTDVEVAEEEIESRTYRTSQSIKVMDPLYVCGVKAQPAKTPVMISSVKEAADRAVICGRIRDVRCKEYDPNSAKEGRRFYRYHYTFKLDDTTGSMRVLFNTNDAACPLKDITSGEYMVRGRVFYSEYSNAFNLAAKSVFSCKIDFDDLKERMKPLAVPDSYRIEPQPLDGVEESVQLSLDGLFDDVGRHLEGTYVFMYADSIAKDKFLPYRISFVRTEDGKAVSHYTQFVYNKDVINVDAEMKSQVTTAKRLVEMIPDLVRYLHNATFVALDMPTVQQELMQLAEALHYHFECNFVDASLLLKKGKDRVSFTSALRSRKISLVEDSAFGKAYALFQLFLQMKGI